MGWLYLILAGAFEVVGVTGLNQIHRRKHIVSYVHFMSGFILSFYFLSLAMRTLPMGSAYAIWTGIGTIGSVGIGMLFYGESKEWKRMLFIALVLVSAIGLKLIS